MSEKTVSNQLNSNSSNNSSNNSSDSNRPTFVLIDGHSLAFRSYYAFAKGKDGGLRTKEGIPTSVSFGFLKSLLEAIASEKPKAIAVAFDLGSPTFRHKADSSYKADRKETPEDFIPDLKNLQELISSLNLPILTAPGFEADDILGSLAQRASAAGYQVKILSGDRDLFQLVDEQKHISVLYLNKDSIKRSSAGFNEFGSAEIKDKLGVLPSQVVDFKALCGDKSDNIPGVRGIGEKTAVKLLDTYDSLDNIYASLDEIKGANHKKLTEGKEDAEKSRFLAKIVLDVPLEVNLEDCKLTGFDTSNVLPILEKLEFKYFVTKINQLQEQFGGEVIEVTSKETDGSSSLNDEGNDLWFFSADDTDAAEKESNLPIEPRIIDSEVKLQELVKLLQGFTDPKTPVAWDTETSALEPRDAELVGIGCCWGTEIDEVAYIPVGHKSGKKSE